MLQVRELEALNREMLPAALLAPTASHRHLLLRVHTSGKCLTTTALFVLWWCCGTFPAHIGAFMRLELVITVEQPFKCTEPPGGCLSAPAEPVVFSTKERCGNTFNSL